MENLPSEVGIREIESDRFREPDLNEAAAAADATR